MHCDYLSENPKQDVTSMKHKGQQMKCISPAISSQEVTTFSHSLRWKDWIFCLCVNPRDLYKDWHIKSQDREGSFRWQCVFGIALRCSITAQINLILMDGLWWVCLDSPEDGLGAVASTFEAVGSNNNNTGTNSVSCRMNNNVNCVPLGPWVILLAERTSNG